MKKFTVFICFLLLFSIGVLMATFSIDKIHRLNFEVEELKKQNNALLVENDGLKKRINLLIPGAVSSLITNFKFASAKPIAAVPDVKPITATKDRAVTAKELITPKPTTLSVRSKTTVKTPLTPFLEAVLKFFDNRTAEWTLAEEKNGWCSPLAYGKYTSEGEEAEWFMFCNFYGEIIILSSKNFSPRTAFQLVRLTHNENTISADLPEENLGGFAQFESIDKNHEIGINKEGRAFIKVQAVDRTKKIFCNTTDIQLKVTEYLNLK